MLFNKNIIINADDFGLNSSVNKAILEAFEKGYIKKASVMTNMSCKDEINALISQFGLSQKLGIHLNLSSGTPLTDDIKTCKRFCNKEGFFIRSKASFYSSCYILNKNEKRAIAKELDAQIMAGLALGIKRETCHLDSHHQVHIKWSIGGIVIKLAQKYGIKKIRIFQNLSQMSLFGFLYKSLYNLRLRYYGLAQSHWFGSPNDEKLYTKHNKNRIGGKRIELMVHPGYDKSGNLVDVLLDNQSYPDLLKNLILTNY
jgi:predicted glycoside hydrolase/deacetylase ChbG (UPF0249 family)